ncbi:MAG: aminotransferase class V-fold PLP-dependent enzyme [Acidimicrobiia bacterium]|nr:aminotransferase class V-fold PLP-dependent enzyme [Acidimicrobiia bacterium]
MNLSFSDVRGPFPEAAGFETAVELDRADPLADHRSGFVITDPDLIYLDGNSLGRMPDMVPAAAQTILEDQWADRLIRSWNEGWWTAQLELGELLAPVVGAGPGEVIISDATSVNLFKLAVAAVRARPGRTKIITDDLNFPTDVYVLDGVCKLIDGVEVIVIPSDGINGPVAELVAAMDETTALVSLSHTVFKSGYTYDMAEINQAAHAAGALVLWDTSHSVGSVPIDFTGSDTDLAVGCTYKYLNGGPGSPAFLYVRSALQPILENPITAWWGHNRPFDFDLDFVPVDGIRRFHSGTMPMLSLAITRPGIERVARAGMPAIREKSVKLSAFLVVQWKHHLHGFGFALASPTDPERRGSHISLSHDEAWPITRALIDTARVIPDFRAPDSIRFGLSPLYTSFVEIHTAVQRVKLVVENGLHHDVGGLDASVT